jgi:hypothetical protein
MMDVMEDETQLWGKLRSPYVNKAFTLYDDERRSKLYLIMQLADLGSLGEFKE